jgi:hypothetical protein
MRVRLLKPEHYDPDLEPGAEVEVENVEYLAALFNAEAVEDAGEPSSLERIETEDGRDVSAMHADEVVQALKDGTLSAEKALEAESTRKTPRKTVMDALGEAQ